MYLAHLSSRVGISIYIIVLLFIFIALSLNLTRSTLQRLTRGDTQKEIQQNVILMIYIFYMRIFFVFC